jgi:monooxygenase
MRCSRRAPTVGAPGICSVTRACDRTAAEFGVDRHVRYNRRVVSADWSSGESRWTLTVDATDGGTSETVRCRFLYLCTGYCRYDEGYTPAWPGRDMFAGTVVHPQQWPAGLDLTDKRVVVSGMERPRSRWCPRSRHPARG